MISLINKNGFSIQKQIYLNQITLYSLYSKTILLGQVSFNFIKSCLNLTPIIFSKSLRILK